MFSFITERRAINASFAILSGREAQSIRARAKNDDVVLISHADQRTFLVAFKALNDTRLQLKAYYKKHGLIGRIVKYFDKYDQIKKTARDMGEFYFLVKDSIDAKEDRIAKRRWLNKK